MDEFKELPRIYTLPQLAEQTKKIGISYGTLYRWLKAGILPHLKAGKRYLINYDTFLEFLKNGGASEHLEPEPSRPNAETYRPNLNIYR